MEQGPFRRPSSPRGLLVENSDSESVFLTHEHISQAVLSSSDGGKTLDFSHKNLSDVGEVGAEELASIGTDESEERHMILRIALGYNRLTTLPMAFTLLTRLRYLNLRANCFTVFPDVLTMMPSLEILDISRNKLKQLPPQPGSLLGLRVFSVAKNKLSELPQYIADASNLTVLQIDHNPFEWPPKDVLEPLESSVEGPDARIAQIDDLRKWMKSQRSDRPRVGLEEISSEIEPQPTNHSDTEGISDDGGKMAFDDVLRRHERNFSVESDISNYSLISQDSTTSDSLFFEQIQRQGDGIMRSSPSSLSFSSTLPSPNGSILDPLLGPKQAQSTIKSSEDTVKFPVTNDVHNSTNLLHARNASYSTSRRPSESRLMIKKSLPELRSPGITNRSEVPRVPNMAASVGDLPQYSLGEISVSREFKKRGRPPKPSSSQGRPSGAPATAEAVLSPAASSRPAPSMDVERNSYFRRLSALPPSSVTAKMPKALLAMIDSARGILFGVSQIYQSLRHYTVFAIDDRLSGVLGKVLETASTYITHLINALDTFDTVSRRGIPPPSVCRGVVESCRDNVAVFGKVIGVLHLQLKVLVVADDARYSRSLLLMLYGSMGEIANSWQTMSTHLDDIVPLLTDHRIRPPAGSGTTAQLPSIPPNTNGKDIRNDHRQPMSPPLPRTPGGAVDGRSRMARRHAGSFSTRDLEIGRGLPSTSEDLSQSQSSANGATLRSAMRKPQSSPQITPPLEIQSSSDFTPSMSASNPGFSASSGQGSSSPFSFGASHQHIVHSTPRPGPSSLEVPSDSSKMVDEDLLNTMEAATETARSVWKMMQEVLMNQEQNNDLGESLRVAMDITTRLKTRIAVMRRGSPDGDRKTFWEDAHFFVKAVVGVLTVIKSWSGSFSPVLKSHIAKLTQSTQDFAILLQVSSFSPAPTPSPYSPSVGGPPITPAKSPAILRSRSAQASQSPSLRPNAQSGRDTPWSALPHQSFKIRDPEVQ